MIDKRRVKIELRALADICQSISYDLDEGWVLLEGIPFPSGWEPRTGLIRYELPDPYPGSQPKAYLPENMRYQGSRPTIMLGSGPDGWSKHCIHDFSDELDDFHTLVTMTRMIKTSLRQPNSNNPFN